MYAPWNTWQQEGQNVNEQVLHNLGRIHGNGKEKAHKAMSELLEKILSKDNMNTAYKSKTLELLDLWNEVSSETASVYMEIGLQAGILLMVDMMRNISGNIEWKKKNVI